MWTEKPSAFWEKPVLKSQRGRDRAGRDGRNLFVPIFKTNRKFHKKGAAGTTVVQRTDRPGVFWDHRKHLSAIWKIRSAISEDHHSQHDIPLGFVPARKGKDHLECMAHCYAEGVYWICSGTWICTFYPSESFKAILGICREHDAGLPGAKNHAPGLWNSLTNMENCASIKK